MKDFEDEQELLKSIFVEDEDAHDEDAHIKQKKKERVKRIYKRGKDATAYKSQYDTDEILQLYLKMGSYRKVAKRLGIKSPSTVANRIKKDKEEITTLPF